ncbi:MAG TPA: glycosyltransferase [Candidatus Elarobacter sp.]|nr:glycosyltransferase [Candidatus Elarobacter sp.]
MRVLFATHSYPRFAGDGAGSFLLRLAQALGAEDVSVRVVAPSAQGLAPADVIGGIPVRRFRYAPRRYETLAYTGTMADDVTASIAAKAALAGMLVSETEAIIRTAREWRADIVHAHWWFPNGVAAATAARLTGVPLVITSHGTDVRLLARTPRAAPIARYAYGAASAVTCVSSWLAQQAAPYTRRAPLVAPMPVAADLFAPGRARATDRIVFAGRLSAQKGIELALRAFARLRAPATLQIIGDGPARDALQRLASELRISDHLEWLATMPQGDLARKLAEATIVVVPSTEEGLGLIAAEAQLCETPVVAFASGGLVDVVRDDETGVLVPPGDVDALACALDALLSDAPRRARLGAAGRASALATFAPDAVARRYSKVYHSVLGRDVAS